MNPTKKKTENQKNKFFTQKVKNTSSPNAFVKGHVLFKCQNCKIPYGHKPDSTED